MRGNYVGIVPCTYHPEQRIAKASDLDYVVDIDLSVTSTTRLDLRYSGMHYKHFVPGEDSTHVNTLG